mmetsp:Transcript_6601/g.17662  ORF Transcript_6601/g.17662 Transcript_6601/m.17662 type:complete len:816 (-) Transcript_6601:94-2541(-)
MASEAVVPSKRIGADVSLHVPLREAMKGHIDTLGSLADPLMAGYLSAVGWLPYLACLAAISVISTVTIVITSDITPVGFQVYKFLLSHGELVSQKVGFRVYELCFGVGVSMIGLGILFDAARWKSKIAQRAYTIVSFLFMLLGILSYTEVAPSVPVILGVFLTVAALTGVRQTLLSDRDPSEFSFVCAVSLFLVSAIFYTVWILWALTPALAGRHYASDLEQLFAGGNTLAGFILWASPVLLASAYLILGIFALLRGRAHVSARQSGAPMSAEEADRLYVLQELKLMLIILTIAIFFSWVAASIAAHDIGLSRTVLRLSFALYLGACTYIYFVLGPERILAAMAEQEAFQMIIDFAKSDWMKGITLLITWPLVPMYFVFEVVHQLVRNNLADGGLVDLDVELRWLTAEADLQWRRMLQWDWASVLTKSIYAGIGYFMMQVGISTGMTMFLSWMSEQVTPWPLVAVLGILFVVGITLFLMPPVPGLPIYLISGIVVVAKLEDAGVSFAAACILATFFCFSIKITANVILQKGVGEVFAGNLSVRKAVGVHTPTMKAVEWILSAKGCDPAKVSVLVGGPDWPTAVMTGILNIRVMDMVAGSAPCFFVILPVVLSAAFTLKAGEAAANPVEGRPGEAGREGLYRALSSVMITLSAVVQMGSMVLAGIYIQAVKEQYKAEFAETRQEDREIIEAIEQDEQDSKAYQEATAWELVPTWLACVLFLGSFLANGMMTIVMFVVAFRDFSITDSIKDPPLNGHSLNIILAPGWLAIAALSASGICLAVYSAWCTVQVRRQRTRKKTVDEETPLLGKALAVKSD